MADRLTQLQVCLDQLIEQFNATINYVNTNAEPAKLDTDPNSVTNIAAQAPLPGHADQKETNEVKPDFDTTINELSSDIIIKSRQISMLIDGLPGIGVPPSEQLQLIESLVEELRVVEKERLAKIAKKDALLKWTEELIVDVANGITQTRKQ